MRSMKLILISALILLFASVGEAAQGQNYAVLVAGSNGYYNYRHQSDICHAFHVLTDKGQIPAENIIVFMYDDIANNPSNPFPGTLINHPNGSDVYHGVTKDYIGAAVTPQNFLAVLAGNKTGVSGGSGRVLPSGPNDNVFVYFSDHGATGLVAFPSEYLYAKDLIATLKQMHDNKKYKQLVFYLEACESGSMFNGLLPPNISIYATTASTPDQSSYACYWDSARNAYLGDEYSVRWMEDADLHDSLTSTWTLKQQFKVVQEETVQSQAQQYGEQDINSEYIENFEGDKNAQPRRPTWLPFSTLKTFQGRHPSLKYTPCNDPADSRDIKLKALWKQRENTPEEKKEQIDYEISYELAHRALVDSFTDSIVQNVVGIGYKKDRLKRVRHAPRDFNCLKGAVAGVEQSCGRFDDYSLKYVYLLANMCEEGYTAEQISAAAKSVCVDNKF